MNYLFIHFYISGDPANPYKEERERIFFSYDDKISMSIEYYDPEADSNKAPYPGIQKSLSNGGGVNVNGGIDSSGEGDEKDSPATSSPNTNPNKRYLECPGSVKVQHLKKFITMKYGLNEDFLVSIYILFRQNISPYHVNNSDTFINYN